MRRVTFALVAILAAVVLQTALLDRLPFPGGSAPNLVLVLVVTLALASGPTEGMLIGFGAGLALDIAPPASNLLGLSALVFCVIGYGCGRLRGPLERSAWLPLAVVALGVAAGEALYALAGMTFGDPDITWQSVRQVLPVSVAYDILLCPFVLYAVVRFGGYSGWATAGRREPESLAGREPAGAGLLGGVAAAGLAAGGAAVRDTRSGREPRLRPAAGRRSDGWIGGHLTGPGQQAGPWVSRRRPLQLRAARRRRWFRGRRPGGPGGAARPGPPGRVRAPAARRPAARRRGAGRLAARHARRGPGQPARPRSVLPAVGPRLPRLGRPGQDDRRRGVPWPAGFRQPVRPAPAAVTRLPRRALGPDRGGPRDAGPDRLAAAARPARGRGARWRRARQPVTGEPGRWARDAGRRLQRPPFAGWARAAAARPRSRRRSPVPEQRPRPAALGRPPAARAPGIPPGRCLPGRCLPGWGAGRRPRWPGRAAARLRPAARLRRGPAQRIPVAGAVA